jgi:hypothetical protein
MPRYPFPWKLGTVLARDLPRGSRSLTDDSRTMIDALSPPPLVYEVEHMPTNGPCLIVANHYERRGLWIAWPGAVISLEVGRRRLADPGVHWLVTGGIRLMQPWNRGPEIPGSRALFRAVARIYGMTALPLDGAGERAAALRSWLACIRSDSVVGLFPEGLRGSSAGLVAPDPEFGRLCAVVRALHCPVLPVGIYENQDRLHIRFGEPFNLPCKSPEQYVMASIAQLLPLHLRGPYAAFVPSGTL